ncbi:hypothetical protein, partial [Halorubrum sp. SD683]|uniref:hypothetical protein n=1 Tax=Halorubrum sp. SD683 TaxID=1855873 RepID=UPI001E5B9259
MSVDTASVYLYVKSPSSGLQLYAIDAATLSNLEHPAARLSDDTIYELSIETTTTEAPAASPAPHSDRASHLPSLVGGPPLRSGPPTPSRVLLA